MHMGTDCVLDGGAMSIKEKDCLVFRCWRCQSELLRMHSERGQLAGWVFCKGCGEGQGVVYTFPIAMAELETEEGSHGGQ